MKRRNVVSFPLSSYKGNTIREKLLIVMNLMMKEFDNGDLPIKDRSKLWLVLEEQT